MGLSCGNPNAWPRSGPARSCSTSAAAAASTCSSRDAKSVQLDGQLRGHAPEMLTKARKNIESYRRNSGLDNVEFRLGESSICPRRLHGGRRHLKLRDQLVTRQATGLA